MSEFRIIDHNFAFDDASNLLSLSEDPSFPTSNLSAYFRSKVYRSSGYFKITTSNQWLDFKDDGAGAEISVKVSPGNYTPTELAEQIEGLLNRNSTAGTYACSYNSSTGRWLVSSTGTYLSLLWTTGTHTASSLASTIGFSAGDSTGAVSYSSPAIAIHTEERVVVDAGAEVDIDSFVMLFDPRIGPKFSNTAVLTLQANNNNEWSSPSVSQVISYDDLYETYSYFFSSVQTYRYWSVKVVDPSNPYGYVEIPKVILGKATTLAQMPEIGFKMRADDPSVLQRTPYGHVYADIYPTRRVLHFDYSAMTAADIETLYTIFQRLGGAVPLVIALDPTAEIYDKDRFILYGYLKQTFETTNRFYNYFDIGLELEEAM
jgi:hypothetical protein